ncbi:amidase [Devosia faecipullorum]|uniref:amidase n=1 Tax=Devosia faecipullorum TaxID=2755039 RepID=UPI00187B81B9|nr:amidase [Devosia faecipullorum]MBE7734075.1 amidase [Devosia faecipullorum]
MTDNTPIWDLTALQLAARFRTGQMRPSEAVAAIEKRIEAINPAINAIIAQDSEALLQAARGADARWQVGKPLSPLDGVPITIKDNIHVAGLPARWGSRAHEHDRPDTDEPAVRRLRDAGLLVLGKTNVPEFTLQGYTDNALFGPTFNPLAPDRTPGGSTGGGAAAVAAGFGPIAIGTDGGGSIRRPAAHCGLWGFKPSIGTIARAGGFPAILNDFEVIGPVTRDAADLAAILAIMAGPDDADPRSRGAYQPGDTMPTQPRILTFDTVAGAPVDPRVVAAFSGFVRQLETLAWPVQVSAEPFDAAGANAVWHTVAQAGLAWHVSRHLIARETSENTRKMVEAGMAVSGADYIDALAGAQQVRTLARRLFEHVDLLISPTIAALAWDARQPYPDTIDGQDVGPRGHAIFTAWANVAGLPALNVPLAMTEDGGGIGVQIIAAPGRDRALIEFAASTLSNLAHAPLIPSRILP